MIVHPSSNDPWERREPEPEWLDCDEVMFRAKAERDRLVRDRTALLDQLERVDLWMEEEPACRDRRLLRTLEETARVVANLLDELDAEIGLLDEAIG